MSSPYNPPPGGQQPGEYQQPGGYQHGAQSWGGSGSQQSQSVGYVGIALAVVGAMFMIAGVTALNWYSVGGEHATLSDLQPGAKDMDVGLMTAYGGFLVWILLILVLAAAVAACVPIGSAGPAMRVIAPLVGVLGVVVTLVALNSYWSKFKGLNRTQDVPDGKAGIFTHSASGLWMTLAGFLIAGIAGVFGPRRSQAVTRR